VKQLRHQREKRKPKGFGVEKQVRKEVFRATLINRMLGGDKPIEEIEREVREKKK
jgi:hypothetical protein